MSFPATSQPNVARGLPSDMAGPVAGTRKFAVLGAGFAGVSVAWHLLQHTSSSAPVSVDLFDAAGIGGGASGASGGLLHPYSPKGKLLWKGAEGWKGALDLLKVAEAAHESKQLEIGEAACNGGSSMEPIAWRRCFKE